MCENSEFPKAQVSSNPSSMKIVAYNGSLPPFAHVDTADTVRLQVNFMHSFGDLKYFNAELHMQLISL